MNLCSDNHDEVCYDGRDCPVCSALSDLDEANEEIKKLTKLLKEKES